MTADEDIAPEPLPAPVARTGPLWIVLFFGLVACTQVANAGWAAWTKPGAGNPELLLAMSSRNRFLVATVSSGISPVTWAIIGAVRLTVAAIVCHMLGRCYGDRALRWFWRYLGMPQEQVSKFENAFAKAEIVVVPFFVGSNIVWVLSGAASTTWKRLAPLLAVGLAGRLALMWWLGRVFDEEVKSFLGWVDRYQFWFIGGSILIVLLVNVRNFRGGR
ncbi:MAG: hypothetical protein Q7V88_15600 [Actinomycetota bacterium]|nr:hypothetical protein [Actinomycetota bacterium]